MHWHWSNTRCVIVAPAIGLVFKFPRFRIFKASQVFSRRISVREVLRRQLFKFSVDMDGEAKYWLLRGWMDNLREARFYRRTHHTFLKPTFFSLFGLCNIQRSGHPCLLEQRDLCVQLYQLTSGEIRTDFHHFAEPRNFCLDAGRLTLVDYGSPKTQIIVEKWGKTIAEKFDSRFTFPTPISNIAPPS